MLILFAPFYPISSVFQAPQNFAHTQRPPHVYYRNHVISQLQTTHSIVMLVVQNLNTYMSKARLYYKGEFPRL